MKRNDLLHTPAVGRGAREQTPADSRGALLTPDHQSLLIEAQFCKSRKRNEDVLETSCMKQGLHNRAGRTGATEARVGWDAHVADAHVQLPLHPVLQCDRPRRRHRLIYKRAFLAQ